MKDLYQIAKTLKTDTITVQYNIALLEWIDSSIMSTAKDKLQVYYYLPTILSKEPFTIFSSEIKGIEKDYEIINTEKALLIKDNTMETKIYKRDAAKNIEVVKDYENKIKFPNLNYYFKVLFNITKDKNNTYNKIYFDLNINHLTATTGYSLFIFHNLFSFQKDLSFSIHSKVFEILSYLDTDFTLYYEEDKFKIKAKNIEIVGTFLKFPDYQEILNDLSKKEYLKPIKIDRKELIKNIKKVSKEYYNKKVFGFYISNNELFVEDLDKQTKIKLTNTDNDIEYRNYFNADFLIKLIKDLKDKEIELYLPVELIVDDFTGDPLKILGKDYTILLMPIKV